MYSAMAEAYPASPVSSDRPLPPVTRPHAVSEVTPARKITFFRSGDPQFSGVKMAINRRSFKSFSALMDDLSNRVPLPFGVRTITTPRGTHNINRLDQLQDGGSYVCSDKKYVQPIAGRKVGAHKSSRPVSARKQGQQDEPEEEFSAAHFQQVPKLRKKVVLVKNGDPTVRRSILLNRRNARNFKTFLEDASDLLQFTVRRLYTVDGRRIENIQGVLQSSSILICAGREPFKPIQSENVRKSVTEKLPGLRSHHNYNHNSEIRDNKKNANFGLKAKKSVIHPRSASSNKTRFSLSSEKSDPNELNMSPANSGFASYSNSCPHEKSEDTGHSLLNDDIEKKVHVNKDGSLSVEMKVRFRLLNEETLQWSTQIKKSSTSGKGKCEEVCLYDEKGKKEMNHETFSETDESFYPCDGDSYSSKLNDAELDMYCAHCGMQCEDYDIWKNPMHANPQEDYTKRATWQTQSPASSTSSHRKLVSNQKASMGSLHTMSSEEYTKHVVHKSSCYSETRENGETTIRYSRVSQCTSRSSQSTAASNVDASSDTARQKTGDSQKSRSSHRSPMSLQNQESQNSEGHLKTEDGSLADCGEPPPTPCSDGENCSQRVELVSQSLHSRTSKRRLLKRDSTNSKSFGSNISYTENEERDQTSAKAIPMNMLSVSTERRVCEDDSESTEQPVTTNELEDQENRASDCDKCSSRASSHSRSSAGRREKNKSCSQNGGEGSCSSPRLSSISKQHSEKILDLGQSLENCEAIANDNRSTSSKSNRKSLAESRGQSFQSNRSHQTMSPIADSPLPQEEVDNQTTIQEDSCNESLKSHCTGKSEECTAATADGQERLPVSRSSSKSQSFSSKYNNVSCPENEKNYSVSSRVSSASEKKGKLAGSSEICDRSSSRDSARAMSQNSKDDEKLNDQNENAETCSGISALETPCIHSPSPPKDKPVKRHLRSSHYKYSSNSMNNDPLRNVNGEMVDSSRSSTSASKGLLVSKISIETCKLLKNSPNNNSTEEIHNNKKRKNSSSSSKRKLKVESLDQENIVSSELTPSALPNVSPEEVVNEWLKKIPSETMAVEYEVEECQKKVIMDIKTEGPKLDADKEDNGEPNDVSITDEQNDDQVGKQMTEVCCTDNANPTAVENLSDKEEIDASNLSNNSKTNNAKDEAGTKDCTCDKRSLPNNIHNSVQIMKALLNPLQESKLDRSNSLPEVSQTMGRKLSNSAQVLISCLAGLQLLNDGPTDPTKNSNDSKCIELLHIFQALWAEGPTNKNITDLKSAKHYSREDELTPVSSSGVDINSGFDGSDGSITGGGDGTATEKSIVKEVECDSKNIQRCDEEPTSSGDQDTGSGQTATTETADAGFDETKSYVMDENMNEKKIDSNSDGDVKDSMKGHEITNSEAVEDHATSNNDTMNILSHNENEARTQESYSQEANDIKSSSQTTIISTSDSNEKNNPATNDQTFDADPVWVLKLLKKIEKEFMTHYVDAMHEFKVRWNLENNDNLEEMIAELKNEVSQRIQRSISNELKKMKSRSGMRMPRPPDYGLKRKSSLQAEERRRRLQAMQRRSMHGYAGGDNMEGGTNDSCETDEEDLTFSASFADDSSGQANDEFCPCEKCIKQKKLAKLAKPRPPVADAPIVRAFDLQQILKIKRENNETKNTGQQACDNDVKAATGKDCPEGQNEDDAIDAVSLSSKADDEMITTKSDVIEQDGEYNNETDSQQDKIAVEEDEICEENDLQDEPTREEEMENECTNIENNLENEDSNVENKSENEDFNVENKSENEDSNVENKSENECSNVENKSENEDSNVEINLENEDSNVENKSENEDSNVEINLENECSNVENNLENKDSNVENYLENEDSNVENKSENEDSNVENKSKNEDSNVENKSTDDLDGEVENAISDELNSGGAQVNGMSSDCPVDEDNTAVVCEDEQPNQLEDVHQDQELPSEHKETKETSDSDDEQPMKDEAVLIDECCQNGACHEKIDTTNPVIKTEENSEDEDTEAVESHGLYFQRSCLGNGSLITQNGSVEDLEECKETNNTLGEASPNGQSNSSGSKHSQMYPDSSSEEEDGDSPRESPAMGKNKSESIGRVSNHKGSFDDCDSKSKKALEDDIIDQDDLDF
ncbi:retinitis pigmentosa 1-like 1 protein [Rana temporaria]|uniref:retinitis pigmentosa 1-like 1 protein n=1 Tax=Rana temporaria TaxID=8407 RepID=UPI001AAD9276|nr:retinitis pigmentosa 1-like 1 protein [Rana temporaria]